MKRYRLISVATKSHHPVLPPLPIEDDKGQWVGHSDALAAIEQARREAFEACESIARTMFNRAATGDEIADAIRARGTLISAQQQLPKDMADVMRQAGDSLIERGEGK